MVEERRLEDVFHALGDATRRAMLRRLAEGEQRISDLGAPFDMSFNAASKHVKVLEKAGLVKRRLCGRSPLCTLAPALLKAAGESLSFYETFWSVRFDALDQMLRSHTETAGGKWKR